MKKGSLLLLLGSLMLSGFTTLRLSTDDIKPNTKSLADADFYADPELAESYKAKVLKEVFDKLKMAKGDFRTRKPFLRFVLKNEYGVASAFPKTGLIVMEEKGYDICTGFGKDSLNALAVFLAHELVHCYEKHDWEEHFAFEFTQTSMAKSVKDNLVEDEVQADYLGGFLAYQAGFKTFGLMPDFLDKVYKTYNLKDENMPNYPPLAERKTIAAKSEGKLKDLIELFEMGNFLTVLEEYEDAFEYYYKILEDFQSREVYNNIGVVAALSGLTYFSHTESKYAYPLELDVNSRMAQGTKGLDENAFREERLMEAIDLFAKARQLDMFYPVAYLNEGCARTLLGISQVAYRDMEWDEAENACLRAIRLAGDNAAYQSTHKDALVQLGILAALKNDKMKAGAYFDKVLEMDSAHFYAKTNKAILRGEKLQALASSAARISSTEMIDNLAFKDISLDKSHMKAILRADVDRNLRLAVRPYSNSLVMANVSSTGLGSTKISETTILQITSGGYSGTSGEGIRIGDKLQTVLSKYQKPASTFSLSSGTFLHYNLPDARGLIFEMDENKLVKRWCLYKKTK